MGTNQPPPGGKYSLWSQPQFTAGQVPLVAPTFLPSSAQAAPPVWQQPLPQPQPSSWNQGLAYQLWGDVPFNPIGQTGPQTASQLFPQQKSFSPFTGGPTPINGLTGNLMPH